MVESARLESVYTSNRIVGSNPTLSAKEMIKFIYKICTIQEWSTFKKKIISIKSVVVQS